MSTPRRKKFFAQNSYSDPKLHRAKYFHSQEEARAWLAANGGGTIKERGSSRLYFSEQGMLVGGWRVVEEVEALSPS
ncbi:MAG: hypothetical protein ICV63_01520 [Coleofasciculus sp. Co-bin14]|nr:hypothetical protein [Coleofasciculus sp. Co-bin14]